MKNNAIIIQDDGTMRLAKYREKSDIAKWFDDGAYYIQYINEENLFPLTTKGLQDAVQRHIAVRHQELLDNHYDNPGDFATERELALYELIHQPKKVQTNEL